MRRSDFSLKTFFIALAVGFLTAGAIFVAGVGRKTTTVVFCDVGQGDGAYIRTEDKIDILIDAGPGRQILNCLGKYMPFWDRTIEMAFLSHPQKDHGGGYLHVLDRYQVVNFISTPAQSRARFFTALQEKLRRQKTQLRYLYAGEAIAAGQTKIDFLWPDKAFAQTGAGQDLNRFSQVFILTNQNIKILFTGDADKFVLDRVTERFSEQSNIKSDLLKVPHHGSKNGLTQEFLLLADPALSVISAGRNNPYGHPSKVILDMLQGLKKKYLRTDQIGDVVVAISPEGWRIED